MQTWEAILILLGGNATLLLLIGWLGRSLVTQLFAKDLERLKSELSSASTVAAERLKHELQLASHEHQVRYAKLHERRAEVIADLYALLVEAQWASQAFVSVFDASGEPSKSEKYVTAMEKAVELYRFFDKNRIYLPARVCEILEAFVRDMRKQVIGFGVYVDIDERLMPDHVIKEKHKAWVAASEYFEKEIPSARAALESELRELLGNSLAKVA